MQKFTPFLVALSLCAADPWQTKSFTEWSDKDVQKILTNSPWVRTVSVETGDPTVPADPGGHGGDGSGRAGLGASSGPNNMSPSDPSVQDPDRTRRAGGIDPSEARSVPVTLRWQSALPVKQALARRKYGAEASTSPEAKKFLDESSNYLIAVSGLTPALMRAPQAKSDILQRTTLSAKGKEPLHATDILVSPAGKVTEAIFVFPKTTSFALDDKDVEFSTQLGSVAVKSKFRLKDMVVNGTLQL